MGLGPSFGLGPEISGRSPDRRRSRTCLAACNGEAEPRRTSGGEAATFTSMTLCARAIFIVCLASETTATVHSRLFETDEGETRL